MSFVVACLGLALIGLPDGALGVLWPGMRAAVGLPRAGLGLVLACLACGTFGAGLVAGRLLGRLGPRAVLAGSALLASGGLAMVAGAPDAVVLCAGAALLGFGAGTLDSGVNAAAAFGFDARRVNWMHGCYGLGAMAGPLALTALTTRAGWSWRDGYAALALVLLAAAALFARTVPAGAFAAATAPACGDAPASPDPSVARNPHAAGSGGGWAAARHPLVRLQVVLFFVYTGLEVTLGQWSFTVFTAGRGMPADLAGLWTGAYWAGLAGGRFVLGAAVARIGADRLLRLCTLGVLAGALGFACAPGAWGGLALVLAGAALAPIFPTLIARAPERLGPAVALHAVGFKVSAAMAGGALLPALAGLAADFLPHATGFLTGSGESGAGGLGAATPGAASGAGLAAIGWCAVAMAVVLAALHERLVARSPGRTAGATVADAPT